MISNGYHRPSYVWLDRTQRRPPDTFHTPCTSASTWLPRGRILWLSLIVRTVTLAKPPNFKQEKQRREDKQRKKNEEKQRKIASRKEGSLQPPKP